jgi:hypothetical protein
MSPSMDILISSNLERLLYLIAGADKTAAYMEDLKKYGKYSVSTDILNKISETFVGYCTNEAETADIISKLIGVVSHKTLLAQLDFVEDPEFELQQLEREGQSTIKQLSIHNFTAAANNPNLKPNIDPIESTEENNDKEQ